MAFFLASDSDYLLDIIIELKDTRPDAKLHIEVSADVKKQIFEIRKSKNKILRRISEDKM